VHKQIYQTKQKIDELSVSRKLKDLLCNILLKESGDEEKEYGIAIVEDESLFEDSSSDEVCDEDCGCTGSALGINILMKEENHILNCLFFL
jgi:hypothetical protein